MHVYKELPVKMSTGKINISYSIICGSIVGYIGADLMRVRYEDMSKELATIFKDILMGNETSIAKDLYEKIVAEMDRIIKADVLKRMR